MRVETGVARAVSENGTLDRLISNLWRARRTRTSVEPTDLSESQASYVMGRLLELALDTGEAVIGWKLGLTNRAQREQMGAAHPFLAPVFASSLEPPILRQLQAPRLEVEFVGRVVSTTPVVLDPWSIGIEIIDSHLRGPLSYPFVVADWGLHAAASIGTTCSAPLPGQRVTFGITTPVDTVKLEGAVPEPFDLDTLLGSATVGWPRRVANGDLLWTGALGQPLPIMHPGRMSAEVDKFGTAELLFLD
jgi:2-keto-4-pentenoate hydratase